MCKAQCVKCKSEKYVKSGKYNVQGATCKCELAKYNMQSLMWKCYIQSAICKVPCEVQRVKCNV